MGVSSQNCCLLIPSPANRKSLTLRSILYPPIFTCEDPQYKIRIVSYAPLFIHIENLITVTERYALVKLSATVQAFETISKDSSQSVISPGRTSSTTFLPRLDRTVQCLINRASEFQGYKTTTQIEGLQVVRYIENEDYQPHFDRDIRNNMTSRPQRHTTFFGFLEADCEHCGTHFPGLSIKWDVEDERLCEFFECGVTDGIIFKAVSGSALFWRNLLDNGTGDVRTPHAGLPVSKGVKLGLNIWTGK
ncbi:hypothetical protein BGW36DRAFT_419341 [Talaromyces proteolyticus]|uniref:Prolyl 4-hydroxylase alpha subunit domain-containing protein n=1 Tax=Talaromyces proteolyticus TaxID=1131652 RepID=A0AAD4PWQ5_9EURO|nr:uncharacterized protein BGW36DRAFT_419341 [Talaromyces proteolyticus]KAH8691889.1 hypothetical protein BGW36DRAFT_419341 [Talaromyces proteolyticus]